MEYPSMESEVLGLASPWRLRMFLCSRLLMRSMISFLTFHFLNLFLKINRCLIYFGAWFVMTSGSFGNDLNSFNKLKDKC